MVGADRHGAARSLCCILGGRLLQEQDGRYCTYATNQQECLFLSRHWADIHCLWQRSSASCRKHVDCRRGPTASALRSANWMAPVWHEAGTLSLRHGGSGLWRTHDGQACHHCGLFTRAVGGRVATGSKCDRGADLSQKHTIKLTHRTHSM